MRSGDLNAPGPLERYQSRLAVMQIPSLLLLAEIVCLVLFFLSLMMELFVERQASTLAVMRSRGASHLQVSGSFALQSLGLGLVALVVGPLVAALMTIAVTHLFLSVQQQDALNILSADLLQVLGELLPYACSLMLVAVCVMAITAYRVTRLDVLALRREAAARVPHKPFWLRFYLDVLAALIALAVYVLSQYVISSDSSNPQDAAVIVTPLSLLAPLLLIVAIVLLFLRLLPLLLQLCSSLAIRSRGAAPMLALAQMARAPYQSLRMTLLLALSTALLIFSQVFVASQSQHAAAVAIQQVGADFSGVIPTNSARVLLSPTVEMASLRRIPGVTGISLGFKGALVSPGVNAFSVQVQGVDPTSFAQVALWPQPDADQPLSEIMAQLLAHRVSSGSAGPVPAFVDDALWNALKLTPGATFSLSGENDSLPFIALGSVHHIPTISSTMSESSGSSSSLGAGLLVDFTSYNNVFLAHAPTFSSGVNMNYYWLRTRDDAASLASVRKALGIGTTVNGQFVYDRRDIQEGLSTDPLTLNLIGILSIGAVATILLALGGTVFASWSNTRTRLTSFAVLHALGTDPPQLASMLTWELALVYTVAIVLGAGFGTFLVTTVVPSLIFTSVPAGSISSYGSDTDFYIMQHSQPLQVVVPSSLVLTLLALVGICAIALVMMIRLISQLSLSQQLRLNED